MPMNSRMNERSKLIHVTHTLARTLILIYTALLIYIPEYIKGSCGIHVIDTA